MQSFFKNLIRFYRLFFSPLIGGECRFYPTCSAYALEAFERFSVFPALGKTLKRILSCHPLHPGGLDPVIAIENSERVLGGSDLLRPTKRSER